MVDDGLQVLFEARLQLLGKSLLRGPQLSVALLVARLPASLVEQRLAMKQAQAQLRLEPQL